MNAFVILELLGSGAPVGVNPAMVVSAQQFDSGRGIGTTLKLANGDSLNLQGTLNDILAKLRGGEEAGR
jgi:hypothetical protein